MIPACAVSERFLHHGAGLSLSEPAPGGGKQRHGTFSYPNGSCTVLCLPRAQRGRRAIMSRLAEDGVSLREVHTGVLLGHPLLSLPVLGRQRPTPPLHLLPVGPPVYHGSASQPQPAIRQGNLTTLSRLPLLSSFRRTNPQKNTLIIDIQTGTRPQDSTTVSSADGNGF